MKEGCRGFAYPEAALGGPPAPAATPPCRATLRDAAAVVLTAWDAVPDLEGDVATALATPVEALHTLLAGKAPRTPREPGAPRPPRQGTKQAAVLAMLRRLQGGTVAQIAETSGWVPHTVHGFFGSLKKKGHAVEVRERIRQMGPNAQGVRGSHSIYQLAPHAG